MDYWCLVADIGCSFGYEFRRRFGTQPLVNEKLTGSGKWFFTVVPIARLSQALRGGLWARLICVLCRNGTPSPQPSPPPSAVLPQAPATELCYGGRALLCRERGRKQRWQSNFARRS